VALDSADRPLSLVLEIGTACSGAGSGRSQRPDVGILVIDNPAADLVAAFLAAHRAFRSPSAIGVPRIDPRIINRVIGAAR
jgi:AmiR/NasT family two-component response regulator